MANEVAIIETRAAQLAEKIEVLVTEARQKVASERLAERFGKGWSVDTLENARNFYNIYAKSEPVVRKSDVSIDKIQTTSLEISSSTEILHQTGEEKSHQLGDQLEMPNTFGINPWSIISIFSPKTKGEMRYE